MAYNNDKKDNRKDSSKEESQYDEKVIYINRVAKVVKGGRRFSFAALVVSGDKNGKVGVGLGKANEVPEAIKKATKQARKAMVPVILKDGTIPHEIMGVFGAGRVLMKPAPEGTGIIACSSVRSIVEAAGVKNIITKSLRRDNPHNVVKATLAGLRKLRPLDHYAAIRGKKVEEILG